MALSKFQIIATNTHSILQIDRTATIYLRSMYPNEPTILEALAYFDVEIAPGLCDMIRSPKAPSHNDMLSCSPPIPRSRAEVWVVYLQQFQKDEDICHRIYCGSGTNDSGGGRRMGEYDTYLDRNGGHSTISNAIVDLVSRGYKRVGAPVLFRAAIPTNFYDYRHLRALFLLLEGTITAKFWLFKSASYGRLTGSCIWDMKTDVNKVLCLTVYCSRLPHLESAMFCTVQISRKLGQRLKRGGRE
ncbi:hypothetical protein E8E11_006602 [Didymella keratinophila]|nr:hypothetical protein E8E11_006602 [Didymella keratinophila]